MRRAAFQLFRLSFCAALLAIFPVIANAQFKAGIQGTVTDNAGAVVAGATVILTSKETNQTQQTVASDDGFYRFSGLAPGLYSVSVEIQNFKRQTVDNVKVDAESLEGVDIVLEVGGISETVTVEAENTGLETEDANIRKTISTSEIRNLPQAGRDPYELLRTAPGILGLGARGANGGSVNLPNTTGPGGSSNAVIFQTENQVPISAGGQRISNNNFQIDGVSVNSLQYGGAAVITPNQESVKEVQISSSSFSAEDGRNSGAQVKVVSQNGTNEFHGSAVFKYNDPGWNAFNKFTGVLSPGEQPIPAQRVEQRYKQFGGSIGGPIIKNKLFFFFSYEGLRNNSSNTVRGFAETEQYRQQVIAARPGSITAQILNSEGIAPRIVTVIPRACTDFFSNATDAANRCRQVAGGLDLGSLSGANGTYLPGDSIGNGFDGIADIVYGEFANPQQLGGDQYNFRLDFNATSKDQIAFTTYITPRNDSLLSDSAARGRPGSDLQNKPLNTAYTGIWTRTISATLLNEFRANLTQFKQNQIQDSSATNFGIPRVEIEGAGFNENGRIIFGAPRGDTTPAIFNQKTFEVRDTITTVIGNQAIRFGGEYRRELNDNDLSGAARPLYTFNGLFNFANDAPVFETRDVDPLTGDQADAARAFRSSNYALFVQDDWKIRPNLTLNLGLRYEYFSPISESEDRLAALILGEGARTLQDARIEFVDQLTDPDRNNFAPRIGFAYSPNFYSFLENKAVIRGGFGIFYNRVPNVLFTNTRLNPPLFTRIGICCGGPGSADNARFRYNLGTDNSPFSYPGNPTAAGGINPATNAPINCCAEVWGSTERLPNSEVYKYSLELQYELPYGMFASIGYEGNQSRNLIRILRQELLNPRNGANFSPVYFIQPDVSGNYNGLNVRIERRFAQGFQVSANYRFAKSLDQLSYEGPGFVTNQTYPLDQGEEWGPSDYDVRHNFNLSSLYELPFFRGRNDWVEKVFGGFEIGGILTANTGFPWTPLIGPILRTPSGEFFGPIRPTSYNGNQPLGNSNNNFLTPGGIFPGGGNQYFGSTIRTDASGNPSFELNPPAIGRNSLRGPKYLAVDMSIAKRFGLPGFGVLGENPNLEIRFNAFNIFNNQNLASFNFGEGNTFIGNSNFGEAVNGLAGRVVEFQARFRF